MPDQETAILDNAVAADTGAAAVEVAPVETTEVPSVEATEAALTETSREERPAGQVEKEELAEFAPSISARLREMTKKAPEFDAVLKKYPDIRNSFEATFRRDAAYREIFPTVAEARQLREIFPNGVGDAQELLAEVNEVAELDNNLLMRDPDGRYPGHSTIIRDIFAQDRNAAIALLENSTREWSREDPDSYNRAFGDIIGATFRSQGIFNHVAQLQAAARASGDANLQQMVDQLAEWVNRFGDQTATRSLSPEAERLKNERQTFEREKAETQKTARETWNNTAWTQSVALQRQIVETHPLIKRLPQTIPAQKRERLVNEVIERVKADLGKSPTFMRSYNGLIKAMDTKKILDLQRAAWSQPWLLNKHVRNVLNEETPGIVQATRPGPKAPPKTPTGERGEARTVHTVPYREGNRWYHANGKLMTTEEVLRMK